MIYTIGLTVSYDTALREAALQADRPLMKLGKTLDYAGGSVWKTREHAQAWLNLNYATHSQFSVYGVVADWDKDTEECECRHYYPWRALLVDSPIVRLVD